MKVGDLVTFIKDSSLGVITKFDGDFYTVLFIEQGKPLALSYVTHDELEFANESR